MIDLCGVSPTSASTRQSTLLWSRSDVLKLVSTNPGEYTALIDLVAKALAEKDSDISTLCLCCVVSHIASLSGNGVAEAQAPGLTGSDSQGTQRSDAEQATRWFSPADLLHHNGVSSQTIYVSVNRKVYDMTSGASFYGPGSSYNVFAGHDATKNLALMSLDVADLDQPDYQCADDEETTTLADWVKKFDGKYPVVGKLDLIATPTLNTTSIAAVSSRLQLLLLNGDSNLLHFSGQQAQRPIAMLHPQGIVELFFSSGRFLSPAAIVERNPKATVLLSMLSAVVTMFEERALRANASISLSNDNTVDSLAPILASGLTMEETSIYERFDAYDFDNDAVFQNGATKLQSERTTAGNPLDDLKMKGFYFTKCVDPSFNTAGYLSWKSKSTPPLSTLAIPEQLPIVTSTMAKSSESDETLKLSFDEVMELVTHGKEVPGCRKISVDIQDDATPTESTLHLPHKPWQSE